MNGPAETLVARVTGVKKKRIVAIRRDQLVRDVDWKLAGAVVVYTEAGLEKLLVALGLAGRAFPWPAAATTDQTPPTAISSGFEPIHGAAKASESVDSPLPEDRSCNEPTPSTPGPESVDSAAQPPLLSANEGHERTAGTSAAGSDRIDPQEAVRVAFLHVVATHVVKELAGGPIEEARAESLLSGGEAAAVTEAAEIAERPLVECVVSKIARNPKIVFAKHPDGREILVKVASNVNFIPGMKLKARTPAEAKATLFYFEGRCPRWRGRY